MADDIVVEQPVLEPQQPAVNPEVAKQMGIALNLGQQKQEEAVQEVVNNEAGKQQQIVVPTFEILKDKFGYETPDAAVAEIEALRQFKAAPPVAEISFENEFNEKLFKAIQAGKVKEVTQMLAQQDRLDSLTTTDVTKDNAADIIKLGMQFEYKDLTPEEIDYKYKKQFTIPKEPVKGELEEDDDFDARKTEWKSQVADIEMNRIIEAKLMKPKLETAKSQIKFPEIATQVDEGYIQYQKQLEEQPQLDAALQEIYKTFTPKTIETKVPFNDEANKIAFEFQYEPDSESFNKAVEMTLDPNKFLNNFRASDGTFDNPKFLKAIYFALNGDKMLSEGMKQAKNATIKSTLPDNSSNGGLQRQFPQTQEPSELDKQMQTALRGYQPQAR